MAEPSMIQKIAALLRSSPGARPAQAAQPPAQQQAPAAPQLGGMAGNAQQILQSRPYQLYVQEARAMGEQPLPPDQWAAQQQGR